MQLVGIMLSTVRQMEKYKCHMIHSYVDYYTYIYIYMNKPKRTNTSIWKEQRFEWWGTESKMGKGGQLYGDSWKLYFWCEHTVV